MGQLTKRLNQVDRENESIREQLRLSNHRASRQRVVIEKLKLEIEELKKQLADSYKKEI